MFANRKRNLFLIGALAISVIAILALAAAPSAAAPTASAEAYQDYVQRHPGVSNLSNQKALGSDYYQRQKNLGNLSIAKKVDVSGSDYYERQAGMGNIAVSKRVDLSWPPRPDFSILNQSAIIPVSGNQVYSDFHARHPEWSTGVSAAADLSDYALRHRDLGGSSSAADTSDYFLRHR